MRGQIETIDNENLLTPIQKFYSGCNIFITGGTGFLGRILIEKLLRSCPEISAIYMLVRAKKGENMQKRVEDLFDDVIFARLKTECPKSRYKVVGIEGDCSLPDLGLNVQDQELLINKVSMVFHLAATVRFDEKLKLAVAINVRATQEVLRLCRQMLNLKSAIYVSTAYSNCNLKVIEEKFYPPPMDSKSLMVFTEAANDKIIEKLTPIILDEWPNTYSYTKAVAEDVIRRKGDGMPVGVFRPSILVSTYREPITGWIDNMYGPTGVCASAASGVLRTVHGNSDVNANIIPVDMSVNSLIAIGWGIGEKFEKCKQDKNRYDIPIYQYESSTEQPISWGKFNHLTSYYGVCEPTIKAMWFYSLTLQNTLLGYNFAVFFLHFLPAALFDFAMFSIGKKPRLLKMYNRIHHFSALISYFALRNWEFRSKRMTLLHQQMTGEDREIFFSDLKRLDWDVFLRGYMRGIRQYLLRDPIETLEEARIKCKRFYWLHQTCKVLIMLFVLGVMWSTVSILVRI